MDSFESLRQELQQGLAMSTQGSYERRLPPKAALPKIRSALKGLRAHATPDSPADVWRTLALAEEALLHYPAAVVALQAAIARSPQADRKDLKRLAQLKEYAAKWDAMGLTPPALDALGRHLEVTLAADPCDHTHRHTRAWLESQANTSPARALKGLESVGGYCDCEVLSNAV